MVRVLIADDSPSTTLLLQEICRRAGLQVVGCARDGQEAVELTARLRPDVVTMDVHMPRLDGIEATRLIMEHTPTPIVVVSNALDDPAQQISFRALAYGAVAVARKPPSPGHADFDTIARQLTETLEAMADVRVIRRRQDKCRSDPQSEAAPDAPAATTGAAPPTHKLKPEFAPRVLAIAASTGGPQTLARLLGGLPATFSLPIVIVQHISSGFVGGLAEWLNGACKLQCCVAQDGQRLLPGHVLFAPDGTHLEVDAVGTALTARLRGTDPLARHLPSATPLFDSVARTCGARAVGLVLTGMGRDGTDGLRNMYGRGALTLAQSPSSCIVPNMPQAAIDAGVVSETLSLAQLPGRLIATQALPQES